MASWLLPQANPCTATPVRPLLGARVALENTDIASDGQIPFDQAKAAIEALWMLNDQAHAGVLDATPLLVVKVRLTALQSSRWHTKMAVLGK